MQVRRSDAITILSCLGYVTAPAWPVDRLENQLSGVPDIFNRDRESHLLQGRPDLERIYNALFEGDCSVEVVDDHMMLKEDRQKPKTDGKPGPKKGAKKTRLYWAGVAVRLYGWEEITEDHVLYVDSKFGKPNPKQSRASVRQAIDVVRGWENEDPEELKGDVE